MSTLAAFPQLPADDATWGGCRPHEDNHDDDDDDDDADDDPDDDPDVDDMGPLPGDEGDAVP